MNMNAICPCPKVDCPNHGYCDKCTSRHVRLGFLNYCGFHTILPTMQQVIDEDPDSPAAKKLAGLMAAQLNAYDDLMQKHELSAEDRSRLLKKVSEFSDH